jgi:hypothetical protein
LGDAARAGLSEDDQEKIVATISLHPLIGELIRGTGGCRKVRFGGKGKGKRGGFRTVHYFGGTDIPVILLALIDKGERANLSKKERNELRKEMAVYAEEYRKAARKSPLRMR